MTAKTLIKHLERAIQAHGNLHVEIETAELDPIQPAKRVRLAASDSPRGNTLVIKGANWGYSGSGKVSV